MFTDTRFSPEVWGDLAVLSDRMQLNVTLSCERRKSSTCDAEQVKGGRRLRTHENSKLFCTKNSTIARAAKSSLGLRWLDSEQLNQVAPRAGAQELKTAHNVVLDWSSDMMLRTSSLYATDDEAQVTP